MKFSLELNDKKAGRVLFLPSDLPRFYHQFYSLLLSILFVWEQLAYQNMFINVPTIIKSLQLKPTTFSKLTSYQINTQFLEQIQLMRWSLGLMMGLDCYNLEFRIKTKSFSVNDVSMFQSMYVSSIFSAHCTLQQTKCLFQFLILRLLRLNKKDKDQTK